MKTIRCLIANIPQIVLADIIQNILDKSYSIEVIGKVDSYQDALSFVTQHSIDVLIIGMENGNLSNYSEIIDIKPDLIVLGLIDDGRKIVVHLNDIAAIDLEKIINVLSDIKGVF